MSHPSVIDSHTIDASHQAVIDPARILLMDLIKAVVATGIVSLILYEAYKLLVGAYRGLTGIKALRKSKKIRILIAGEIDGLRAGIAREFRDRAASLEAPESIPGGTSQKFKIDFDEFSLVEVIGDAKECCDNNEPFDVLIFPIDRKSLDQTASIQLFKSLMNQAGLKDAAIMIYALEQDIMFSEHISEDEIVEMFGLKRLPQKWTIHHIGFIYFFGYDYPMEDNLYTRMVEGIEWIKSAVE